MQNGKDGTQMKATGIVRRIDELGRVVIPKEIRRTQRIRRGDPLEIFTTGDGEVIFKKYSPVGELQGVAVQYAEVLSRSFALTAFVADRDRILAAAGGEVGEARPCRPQRQPAAGKGDGVPQALPQRWRPRACPAALRGFAAAIALRVAHHRGRGCHRGRGSAGRGPHPAARPCPAEGCGCGGSVPGKADGRVNIIIIGGASAFLAGAPFLFMTEL